MKVKMKRKGIGIVLTAAAILLMAGCTGNAGNSGNTGNTANIAGTSEQPSAVYVPVDTDATSDNTMNVVEGAYINSFASGYISQNEKPEPYNMYLITTEEEVEYAEDRLGMKAPEDEDELWAFSVNVAEAFQTMKDTYPISDYNYLLYYSEYSEGGHYHHSDSVIYDDEHINFHFDEVKSPKAGEPTPDMMDGNFDMAAIPKSFFDGKNFTNVTHPLQYGYYPISYVFDEPIFVEIIDGSIVPVEVSHGLGGEGGYSQSSSTDPEMIARYIDALRDYRIKTVIENRDDMNFVMDGINDYIFTLEDGTEVLISIDANMYANKEDVQYVFEYNSKLQHLNNELDELNKEQGVNG